MDRLPRYSRRLVGRRADVDRVEAALAPGAVVTLLGPGGIGKTRLAAEVARLRRKRRILWVDAGAARDLDRLADLVVEAVHAFSRPRTFRPDLLDPCDRATALLSAEDDSLCVLDCLEHLARPAADLLARWSFEASGVSFLVTTRNALGLAGERIVRLSGLDHDAARLLLTDSAATGVDAGDEAMRTILDRLEGIPLAIELAAARLAVLTPAELADRLSAGLLRLRDPLAPPGAPHATLKNTVLWSWSLLSAWERSALIQLTVFRGGIPADAACAVLDLGVSEDVATPVDALQALVTKSLLRPDPGAPSRERRFLVYDVVAEVVGALPDAAETIARASGRHAAWFAKKSAVWAFTKTGTDADDERRLQSESSNLAAALDRERAAAPSPGCGTTLALAAAASRANRRLHGAAGALARLDAVLSDPGLMDGADVGARARARLERARLLSFCGRHEAAVAELLRTLADARESSRADVECFATGLLGDLMVATGRPAEGLKYIERAHALSLSEGLQRLQAVALVSLALRRDLERDGDGLAAVRNLEAAVVLNREMGNELNVVVSLAHLSWVQALVGHADEAAVASTTAVEIARGLKAPHLRTLAGGFSGVVELMLGRAGLALPPLAAAVQESRQAGNEVGVQVFGLSWGCALLEVGELERAHVELVSLESRADGAAADAALHGIRLMLALAELRMGNPDAAERLVSRVLEIPGGVGVARTAHPLARALKELVGAARCGGMGREAEAFIARSEDHIASLKANYGQEWAPASTRLIQAFAAERRQALSAWTIAADGSAFAPPHQPTIDLSRRRSLSLLVAALAECRRTQPGVSLSAEELVAAGWPGEELLPHSAKNRLYVALSQLRKLGLSILERRVGGWRMDPAVWIRRPD